MGIHGPVNSAQAGWIGFERTACARLLTVSGN